MNSKAPLVGGFRHFSSLLFFQKSRAPMPKICLLFFQLKKSKESSHSHQFPARSLHQCGATA